jgi:hypothetical protein
VSDLTFIACSRTVDLTIACSRTLVVGKIFSPVRDLFAVSGACACSRTRA